LPATADHNQRGPSGQAGLPKGHRGVAGRAAVLRGSTDVGVRMPRFAAAAEFGRLKRSTTSQEAMQIAADSKALTVVVRAGIPLRNGMQKAWGYACLRTSETPFAYHCSSSHPIWTEVRHRRANKPVQSGHSAMRLEALRFAAH
jgi:hypothetical protein